ncbi:hypothetical protein [Caulobacter sp. S45]|uniref:hypothetical protein n=1 Tax=Caulobacter sp. S45 TaxID=1641861 RepID=UPI00131E960A|nr:hypothetical protein [Caulobacter sp. S45]
MTRPFILVLLIAAQAFLQAAPASTARAAGTSVDPADVRRGFTMVGSRASDEPALRLERQTREPSTSFMLGAALGAWISAASTLDYDLKTPSGDGGDEEAIGVDCYDERAAFTHLEAHRQALGLAPSQVTAAAGVADPKLLAALTARDRAGAPPRCR